MKKSNKALSIIISIIYAAVAVEWIISIVLQYLKIKSGFSPAAEILYFVPAVLMLIIADLEIYRLVKGKYKVLDSVLFLILPFVMCISAFVLAPGIVDSNGASCQHHKLCESDVFCKRFSCNCSRACGSCTGSD